MKGWSTAFGQRFPAQRLIPFLGLLLAFFLWPSLASADSGTPFMFAMGSFQVCGTLVLGLLEGILIALVFRAGKIAALFALVFANYASMAVGLVLLSPLCDFVFGHFMNRAPLYDMPRLEWILVGISFVITLLVEWPFCLLLLWRKRGRWWKSVLATGLAQTASYALLIPFFLHISEMGLYRDVDVDPSFVASVSDDAVVYFLSSEDGDVYRVRLDGQDREKVTALGAKDWQDKLFPRRADDGKHVDLWSGWGIPSPIEEKLVLPNVGVLPFPDAYNEREWAEWTRWYGYGVPVLDFRSAQARAWEVRQGEWGDWLISAKDEGTGQSLWLSFETPYLLWYARHAAVMPGDKVVFELTDSFYQLSGRTVHVPDEIVLLDLRSRKLGLITYGRSPVVVFPEQTVAAGDTSKPD